MEVTGGIGSVAELLSRIRRGLAPRALRLFAAQGLLPVSREELIRVVLILAADGDTEIAEAAHATLATFTPENFIQVLHLPDIEPIEIDLLCRCAQGEEVWVTVVQHAKTANETLRWLARQAPAKVQDVIITNQVRVLACLELLEDLRANPQVSQDVLRRAREFEEEFLEKAIVWAAAEGTAFEVPAGPSIEDVLSELRALGMRLPGGEVEAQRFTEPEAAAAPELHDAFARIALMNTAQRVMQALKGTREERLILVRDRSPLVVRAVMLSPKLNEMEIEQIAGMRSTNEEALRLIGSKGRWLRRYPVLRNLSFNPKTPAGIALQLVRRLSQRDLMLMSRDRNVSETVRRVARDILEHRR
ncbi:MAG: hypothetical protein B7Z68_01220 [Acidobacteria bacterium 21-70-11]|nr:MAG: hypothetical protein B7Z68_01220 [Acidobacteria bacterium 21-70-11]